MAPVGKKPSKPIYKTEAPFTETTWPAISKVDQDIIQDLLCNLLEPIGHHRHLHAHPSKGKKRKRTPKPTPDALPTPPPPEATSHILIGLNSVTRHLSELAARTAPKTMPVSQKLQSSAKEETREAEQEKAPRPLSVVVLPHPHPPSSLPHAHVPTLVYLSSTKINQPTRLVTLSTASEARLASTLRIPRVGAIGILEGAPGAASLVEYVRSKVGLVECKWIEEGLKAEWKGVKTAVQ